MNSLILLAALAAGQPGTYDSAPAWQRQQQSAEARREARDQLIRSVGDEVIPFTKHYGDLGIYGLLAVEARTAKSLVKLHDAGAFARVANMRGVLEAVQRHGDAVGVWLVANHAALEDQDACACFVENPCDFAFDLRDIRQAAERRRHMAKPVPLWEGRKPFLEDPRQMLGMAMLVGAIWICIHFGRKQFHGNRP